MASNSRLSASSPGPAGAWAEARPAGMMGSKAAILPSERNSRRSIDLPHSMFGVDDRPGTELGKDARRKALLVGQFDAGTSSGSNHQITIFVRQSAVAIPCPD